MIVLLASTVATTAVLAVLLLGGLLAIYFVLRERLAAFGSQLQDLRTQVDAVARREPEELPRPATALAVDLGPLERELAELRRVVGGLSRQLARLDDDLTRERGVRLRDRIERRFQVQGYQSVRVLVDPEALAGGNARVSVEGMKGGTTYKGYVVVENGQVVDEKMTSSYEAFP